MRRAFGAVAAVVAVLAVTAGAIWLVRPKDDGHDAAKAWEAKARKAFQPLVDRVPELVRQGRQWQAGELSTDAYRQQVNDSSTAFSRARQQVAALGPSPNVKEAGRLYTTSADLYVSVGNIYAALVETQPGDVRTQVDLLARRVRELADRVYDRGHSALAPYLDEQTNKDVEVRLPEEVPIWPAEGLAAGPPLDDPPAPTASSPPLRAETRPEQSESAWQRDVRAAGIPSHRRLEDALASLNADQLRDLAREFGAAAERLRDKPDPKGERDRSALLRLGLLVDAEAARSAQAATVNGGSALQRVGAELMRVGDRLVEDARR